MPESYDEAALEYHSAKPAGKLEIAATKPLTTQRDLALAYSPGVAAPCLAIAEDSSTAAKYTARGNLVAVVTNGSAVLGLGNIGPLASKPVMEGKAVLFKKFAGIDVFDIELQVDSASQMIDTVAALEPTFGGINLEDIAAPDCFVIEKELRKRMNIPVFHDDQHGTAIIVCAAIKNALELVEKDIAKVKITVSGAGAAALACLQLLQSMGLQKSNILVVDRTGVVHQGRAGEIDEYKAVYARDTDKRTLDDAIAGADIFLGLSGPGVLSGDMVKTMADNPIIMALANPTPEILPEIALAARDDAIIATGRSDYPNQVNNVLCFPYLFRGALDVGATTINEAMKLAAVSAIAELAKATVSAEVHEAYGGKAAGFGRDKLIPKPFDPRLISKVSSAVAQAAMDSGVATRHIEDMAAYRQQLNQFMFRSGMLMRPIIESAQQSPKKLVLAEGEGYRTILAAKELYEDNIAQPILIARPEVVSQQARKLGISEDFINNLTIINPLDNSYKADFNRILHGILGRQGVSTDQAKHIIATSPTTNAALMVELGHADAMLCGTIGPFREHLSQVKNIIGLAPGVSDFSTIATLILPTGTYFILDSHVSPNPTAEEIVEMTTLSVEQIQKFGVVPKVALLSHSNFGTTNFESACKMRLATEKLRAALPDLELDGEMHADAALSREIRDRLLPEAILKGEANTLVMPNIDAAHISYNLLKMLGGGVSVGPILVGARKPAHVLTNSATVRGIVNMGALAVVDAQSVEK